MSSSQPRTATRTLPLLGHADAHAVAAWRRGEPVTAGEFLAHVRAVAHAMPDARFVLNACAHRYAFAVTLLAAVLRGQVTLLPASTTRNVIAVLRREAPDAYWVGDDDTSIDLPRFAWPAAPARVEGGGAFDVPHIAADQVMARIFTSGSTGEPQAHVKTWGGMQADMAAERARLGVGPAHAILGTVPPQHMYGFESTILLPLASGAALTDERLYLPADIDSAIRHAPAPRILFTTPFHLKAWLAGPGTARVERIVCATAPLSVELAREAEARTGAQLFEIYGCTEAGQVASRRTALAEDWTLLDGLRLRESAGQAVVFGGHVEQPTPLQDVIELRPDGRCFVLHGRFADVVNIAGKRNSLRYLDHQLLAIPGVTDGVFFMPEEDEPDGVTRLTAFVVAPTLTARDVLAGLRERLDAAFIPRPLHMVETLPRMLTGKIPREALRALAARLKAKP
ncbi:MAG TPA: AMP-binding protein [Usitatibacter sp.]|jgi:acyl-coenzyme A synthetase/AMP-(fatty) acid ligase|nr:AMP-binding protein [Usitatibacter sp.]